MAVLLSDDYQSWTTLGSAWTSTVAGYAELTDDSPSSGGASSKLYNEFTLSAIPISATLSIQVSRETVEAGQAISSIRLTKPPALVEGTDDKTYKCIRDHIAEAATNKPISGSEWARYWVLYDAGGGLGTVWQADLTYQVTSVETLYSGSGELALEYVLDELDVTEHLQTMGTYRLTLYASVAASNGDGATVTFEDLSLVTGAEWEIELNETAPVSETLVTGTTFLELAATKEFFTIARTTPFAATDEKLLCAKTDSKVYEFEQGTPEGTFDTRDEDFNLPGQEKTLAEIHLSSSAESPHTVEVFISTNSGRTWTSVGVRTLSRGTVALVYVWVTKEAFTIRFRGDGLHLDTFTLYAIPRGQGAPVTD